MRAFGILAVLLGALAGCAGESTETTTTRTPTQVNVLATSDGTPRFMPDNVTLQLRDTLQFRVLSGRHTVDFNETRGLSNPHSGDLGVQTPFAVRFTDPGVYHYSCKYHPEMKGVVHVEPL